MNLKEIRTKFIELSGRFDLVVNTTDYVDNGANFLIQAGSKFLDQHNESGAEAGSVFYKVPSGSYYLFVPNLRTTEEVWAYDAAVGVRLELVETNREGLRDFFPSKLINHDTGFPALYYPGAFKIGNLESFDTVSGFMIQLSGDQSVPNGIIFPPTDRVLTIEVIGKFFSYGLEKDTDENFWSVNYPLLLIWASLYNLEITYRNSEGAKDWLAAISQKLFDLSCDPVDQASVNIKQMKG